MSCGPFHLLLMKVSELPFNEPFSRAPVDTKIWSRPDVGSILGHHARQANALPLHQLDESIKVFFSGLG